MTTHPHRIPEHIAAALLFWNAVYRVLVEEAGARRANLRPFLDAMIASPPPSEWRFQGTLGFGGKLWPTESPPQISCYPEDETPDRAAVIKRVNAELAELFEDHRREQCP